MTDVVNIGVSANDGTGDALRVAMQKINLRFWQIEQYGLSNLPLATVNRGAWTTATAYNFNDVVTSGGIAYLCVVPHTSAASFSTDLAANRWVLHRGVSHAELASTIDPTRGAGMVGYDPALDYAVGTAGRALKAYNGSVNVPVWESREPLGQRHCMSMNLGGQSSPIFSGATLAPQGISVLEVAGVKRLFCTQRVSGGPPEQVRILSFLYREDGLDVSPETISPPLIIGHGQDCTATYEGGKTWIYTTIADITDVGPGKGISRIEWKGASTTQDDVTNYQLLHANTSNERRSKFYQATPTVSTDGRFIILIAYTQSTLSTDDADPGEEDSLISSGDSSRMVLVFDKAAVLAAANPLNLEPVASFPYIPDGVAYSSTVQGLASDGKTIYVLAGGTGPGAQHSIACYNFQGTCVWRSALAGIRGKYGYDGYFDHPSYGTPHTMEPEGLCVFGNKLLYGIQERWATGASIVTFRNNNYACRVNGTTGGPGRPTNWIRTLKAANAGTWSSANAGSYTAGSISRNVKPIVSLEVYTGEAGQWPATDVPYTNGPGGSLNSGRNSIDISHDITAAFQRAAHNPQSNEYVPCFYHFADEWRYYDPRHTADNTRFALMAVRFASDAKGMYLRGAETENLGASLNLHSNDDPTYPGLLRLHKDGAGVLANGQLLAKPSGGAPSAFVTYRAVTAWHHHFDRAGTLQGGTFATESGVWLASRPGGVVSIGSASMSDAGTRTAGVAMDMTGNNFYPGADNAITFGKPGNRISVVHAATGSINTSDARMKVEPGAVSDPVLDAWAEVDFKRYKLADSVQEKGSDGARWHFGALAQTVVEKFQSRGIDPFRLAFLCYDEWPEVREPVMVKKIRLVEVPSDDGPVLREEEYEEQALDANGDPATRVVQEAGNMFGIRYEEALVLEAALQRRERERLEVRIAALEAKVSP